MNFKFRNINDFLDYLPNDELVIVETLRELVLKSIPNVNEHLAYNVPYYKMFSNVCFIWPASILWGKDKTYEGVRFGFTKGFLLKDKDNYLLKGNRKFVYWRDFSELTQTDLEILKSFIYDAVLIDEIEHNKRGSLK